MQFDHLKRREFIDSTRRAATWPLAARAQQSERVRRIGLLMGAADDPAASAGKRLRLGHHRRRRYRHRHDGRADGQAISGVLAG